MDTHVYVLCIHVGSRFTEMLLHFVFRVLSHRRVIGGAKILISRDLPVDQIHNLMSCFDH